MADPTAEVGWRSYALEGRPDFLNYLRLGDVTWERLWCFYREKEAEPASVLRLMGLFHGLHSHRFDDEGCLLDPDLTVYPRLREWARFAVDYQEQVSEERLREHLADLLSRSLISPLYYEAAFQVFLEATLQRCAAAWRPEPARDGARASPDGVSPHGRRLSVQLADPPRPDGAAAPGWSEAATAVMERTRGAWDDAYAHALGDEAPEWLDEGGGG